MLNEMFDGEHQTLNERPYSRTQSAIDSTKGKVKGMFGSGQVEQGAAEVGQEANKYWANFKKYIGRKYGKPQQSVSYEDVAAFFKGNNLDIKFLGNNPRMSFSPKDVGNALLDAIREQMNQYPQDEQEQSQPGEQGEPQNQNNGNPAPSNSPSTQNVPDVLSSLTPEERTQLIAMLS